MTSGVSLALPRDVAVDRLPSTAAFRGELHLDDGIGFLDDENAFVVGSTSSTKRPVQRIGQDHLIEIDSSRRQPMSSRSSWVWAKATPETMTQVACPGPVSSAESRGEDLCSARSCSSFSLSSRCSSVRNCGVAIHRPGFFLKSGLPRRDLCGGLHRHSAGNDRPASRARGITGISYFSDSSKAVPGQFLGLPRGLTGSKDGNLCEMREEPAVLLGLRTVGSGIIGNDHDEARRYDPR